MRIMSFQKYVCSLCIVAAAVMVLQCQGQSCPSESDLIREFNEVSKAQKLYDADGHLCIIEDEHEDEHDDDNDHEDEDDHDHEDEGDHDDDHVAAKNSSFCETVYNVTRGVILGLELTTEDCLSEDDHGHGDEDSISDSEAYGYGFLMVIFVCVCSLGGIALIPLIRSESPIGKRIYEHVYTFMVALAISALVSDAILHLIPHAFELHAHEEEGEGDGHAHEEGGKESLDFIWKGCLVLLGIYGFYLLELFLHFIGHSHHHKDGIKSTASDFDDEKPSGKGDHELMNLKSKSTSSNESVDTGRFGYCARVKKIKPVAWLIIIGDSVHNFADGLALGAAISQSLALGLSTMFALIFHELPHEFGDFLILVKSGFHWGVALGINFLQSLGAVLGFFIGVAVSTNSVSASNWILAITAGLFLYIALTDLLPELIHGEREYNTRNDLIIRCFLINVGFFLGFVILLLLAIYEEDLETLI